MKLTKLKQGQLLYLIIGILVLALSVLFGGKIETILFYTNITLTFVIVGIAQFSLLSVMASISNYMLANIYMVYKTGIGYGLLGMSKNIFMFEIDIIILILNLSLLFWSGNSKLLERERVIIGSDHGIKVKTCRIMAIISVMMAYIAFPSFQFGITANRFQSLLPGHFWNHFMVVFMIIALYRVKESTLIKTCLAIITIWCLFHGERVDIIGIYLFLLIRICVKKNYKINIKFLARFGIIIVFLFVVFIYIGETRVGGKYVVNASSVLSSFLSQGTASDVGYVLNSSIDYINNNGLLMGKTYITYIQGIIPFLDQPMRAGKLIQNIYHTAGGEYILIEPYINFGYIGVVIILNIVLWLLTRFLRKLSTYRILLYGFLIATSFRYIWYGLTYIETGILYLLPIAYFMAFKIFGNKKTYIKKEVIGANIHD